MAAFPLVYLQCLENHALAATSRSQRWDRECRATRRRVIASRKTSSLMDLARTSLHHSRVDIALHQLPRPVPQLRPKADIALHPRLQAVVANNLEGVLALTDSAPTQLIPSLEVRGQGMCALRGSQKPILQILGPVVVAVASPGQKLALPVSIPGSRDCFCTSREMLDDLLFSVPVWL